MTNSRDGIARLEGYVIDVEGAGRMIGTRVKAKVTKVFKTYARARLVSTDDSVAQAEQAQEPGAGDQVPAARAQGSAGKDQTAAAGAASVAGTTGTRVATATPASAAGAVPASDTAAVSAPATAAVRSQRRRQSQLKRRPPFLPQPRPQPQLRPQLVFPLLLLPQLLAPWLTPFSRVPRTRRRVRPPGRPSQRGAAGRRPRPAARRSSKLIHRIRRRHSLRRRNSKLSYRIRRRHSL